MTSTSTVAAENTTSAITLYDLNGKKHPAVKTRTVTPTEITVAISFQRGIEVDSMLTFDDGPRKGLLMLATSVTVDGDQVIATTYRGPNPATAQVAA